MKNPFSYRDGYSFTWANGRQLASITKDNNALATYTYNADGLRTSKTVNGVTTNYYWINGILQGQKTGDEYIIFLYDENGTAYGMLVKNGTAESTYYYVRNLQGDIIGILDSNGTQVVSYTYGAWGDILSVGGSLASTIGQQNPLRYRGYYYDGETGFYYLQSRYYDAEIGRFINADGYLSTGQGIIGNNMFAYCGNNPFNNYDPTGEFFLSATIGGIAIWEIAAAAFTALVVGLTTYAVADTLVKNPPVLPSISLPNIDVKPKAETKEKDKTITVPKPRKDPVHHIVAQNDTRAKPAQEVLAAVGIDRFTDPANLVQLPAYYHHRLHTTAYYEYVNETIVTAYQSGGRENVYSALAVLKWEISTGAIW